MSNDVVPDRWGAVSYQWEYDFGLHFAMEIREHLFDQQFTDMLADFLIEYVEGVRAGWSEEQKTAHVLSITERCPSLNFGEESVSSLRKMKSVYDWLEKLAQNDEKEWLRLIVRLTAGRNVNYKRWKTPDDRLRRYSPIPETAHVNCYRISVSEGKDSSVDYGQIGNDVRAGGVSTWDILRAHGVEPTVDYDAYVVIIPEEAIKLMRVVRVKEDLGIDLPRNHG